MGGEGAGGEDGRFVVEAGGDTTGGGGGGGVGGGARGEDGRLGDKFCLVD